MSMSQDSNIKGDPATTPSTSPVRSGNETWKRKGTPTLEIAKPDPRLKASSEAVLKSMLKSVPTPRRRDTGSFESLSALSSSTREIEEQSDAKVFSQSNGDGSMVITERITRKVIAIIYKDGRRAEFAYHDGVLDTVQLPSDMTLSRDCRGVWMYESGREVGGEVLVDHRGTIEVVCKDPQKSFILHTNGVKECLDYEGNKLFVFEDAQGVRVGRNAAGQVLFTLNPFKVFRAYKYSEAGILTEIHTTRGAMKSENDTQPLRKSETLVSMDGKTWFNPSVSLEPLEVSFKVNKRGSLITMNELGQPIFEEMTCGKTVNLTAERPMLNSIG